MDDYYGTDYQDVSTRLEKQANIAEQLKEAIDLKLKESYYADCTRVDIKFIRLSEMRLDEIKATKKAEELEAKKQRETEMQ